MSHIQKTLVAASSLVEPLAEKFLTENELAKRHQRNPKTLRNDRVKGGYIPFIQIGRSIRYRLSDILAYERAHRVEPIDTGTGSLGVTDRKSTSIIASSLAEELAEIFLTEKQLAERHQRAAKTLRNDRMDGRYIAFYKIEHHVRYRLSDVLAYEAAHCMTSTSSTVH